MKTSSNMVVEVCPHCENEIEMRWDTSTMGFRAFCPVCGNRLMLCDESDAYAFANMESARRSMKADVDVELRNLTDAGYRDIVKEESEDEASVYVRGLDIYYEWSIIPSHLEGE